MAQAAYRFDEPEYVIAVQWTGSNLADFSAAGYTGARLALAEDNETLVISLAVGYSPVPLNFWLVSTVQQGTIPNPLPELSTLWATIMDPGSFSELYTVVS